MLLHRTEVVLEDFVLFNTSANPPYETSLIALLSSQLHQGGYKVQRRPVVTTRSKGYVYQRQNLLAERGNSNRSILFQIHVDTHDAPEGWLIDKPFILDGKMYGLGAATNKTGLTAMVQAALKCSENAGYNIKLAFTVDGLGKQKGMHQLLKDDDWLDDVEMIFTHVPIGRGEYSTGLQCFTAWQNEELIGLEHPAISFLTDYLADYLGRSDINCVDAIPPKEIWLMIEYFSAMKKPVPIIGLSTIGKRSDDWEEWVNLRSVEQLEHVFQFIMEDAHEWCR